MRSTVKKIWFMAKRIMSGERGTWVATAIIGSAVVGAGVARPRELKFCSSMILASSLLRLHQAVAMAASIVTSVPCKSHSPPGLQGGGCRVGRSGGDPPPPEMALPPAKKGCCCKRQ